MFGSTPIKKVVHVQLFMHNSDKLCTVQRTPLNSALVVERKHLFEQIRVKGNEVDSEMTKAWRKKIYRSLRQDYRNHVEDICKQMEEAQDIGEV